MLRLRRKPRYRLCLWQSGGCELDFAFGKNPARGGQQLQNEKHHSFEWCRSGAATQIRTGDLILTKDVLYQLSHSSTLLQVFPLSDSYYNKKILLCQAFFIKKTKYCVY